MSTKTTFKRIALVAVAALGLGVLSVAPSSAVVSNVTVTVADGTSTLQTGTTGGTSDTTTAATVSVSALFDASTDTIVVTVAQKSVPTGASRVALLGYLETTTGATSQVDDVAIFAGQVSKNDSETIATAAYSLNSSTPAAYAGATFFVQLESGTGTTIAGSYVYTAVVKQYNNGLLASTTTKDITIVVAALASASKTVAPASSTAYIQAGTTTGGTSDAVVTAVATASNTARATIQVITKNAAGSAAAESITATLTGGAGLICTDDATPLCGTSLVIAGDGDTSIFVRSNGTAGTATIAVSTTTATFASKTVTFYAKSPKTITASINNPTLLVGANSKAVKAVAVDSNGTAWTGQLYIVASAAADALIGGSATIPVACSYDSTKAAHFCPVTTKATGTASFASRRVT